MKLSSTVDDVDIKIKILATRTSAAYSLLAGAMGAIFIEIVPLAVKMWLPDLYKSFILTDWFRFIILFALLLIFISVFYWKKSRVEKPLIKYFKQNPEFENPNEKEKNR